jgi:hypothetical protein
MRLTFVIVTVIFTALLTYAKLISLAAEPASEASLRDDCHSPALFVHAAAVLPKSH